MMARFFGALFLAVFYAVHGAAETVNGVGLMRFEPADPLTQRPMDAAVFYPSTDPSAITRFGPYHVSGTKGGAFKDGRYPVILLSHGNRGSMLGHHDTAGFLAQQGYVVISLTHPGDNFQDAGQIGTTASLYGRPMQITAALNAALVHPVLGAHIDERKIGFVGFSAGGATGLILAGAQPVLPLMKDYCAAHAGGNVCEAGGRIRLEGTATPVPDPRIRAFVLLAPLSVMFPADALKPVTAPMLIFVGDQDDQLAPDANAMALAHDMQGRADLKIIPHAGHFTFLAPCSPDLTQNMPDLCRDGAGVDRIAIHRQVNEEMAAFFTKSFAQGAQE